MRQDPNRSFECPLRRSCLSAVDAPFSSFSAANEAVARYQSCARRTKRHSMANRLYLRHLRLVRKTLARFCPRSQCHPGSCLIEELMGETYPIFEQALDDYEPSFGVDFLGYVSRRLYWGLEHCARRLERTLFRAPPAELAEQPAQANAEEARLLDRLEVEELLSGLAGDEATLMTQYAAGHTFSELADSFGVSSGALRKRVERLRAKLRTNSGS